MDKVQLSSVSANIIGENRLELAFWHRNCLIRYPRRFHYLFRVKMRNDNSSQSLLSSYWIFIFRTGSYQGAWPEVTKNFITWNYPKLSDAFELDSEFFDWKASGDITATVLFTYSDQWFLIGWSIRLNLVIDIMYTARMYLNLVLVSETRSGIQFCFWFLKR